MNKYNDISKYYTNNKDVNVLLDCIYNVLFTDKGERLFNRGFGSNISKYLFEPASFSVSRLLLSDAIACINRWVPDVTVLPESDVLINIDNRTYELRLSFRADKLESSFEMVKTLKVRYNYD